MDDLTPKNSEPTAVEMATATGEPSTAENSTAEAADSAASSPLTAEAPTADAVAASDPPQPTIEIDYPEDDLEAVDEESARPTRATEPEPASPANRFGTSSLTKLLKEHQPLAQALESQPRAKAQLYQMARRSQELGQYQEVVPSLARAREAVQAASQLRQLDQVYFGNDPQQFWNSLYTAQMQPDPITGQPRSSGAYERNVQFLHQIFLDRMEQQALREKNTKLSGAVLSFRDALGWNPTQSSPAREGHGRSATTHTVVDAGNNASDDVHTLPPHIRQKLEQAELNTRELEQLRARRNEDERRQAESFMGETATEVATELRNFVGGLLENAKLSDYDKRNIARDFIEETSQLAGQDKVHNAALEEILRAGGNTTQTRAKIVARAKAWARQNGRDVLEPILARAGAGLKQRQAQRDAAQSRARTEPTAAGAPASPRAPTARDLVRTAESRLGRRLTDREILELV